MSFLEKLGLGLKKSSSKISQGISDIFAKKRLDTATLDELEELLLTADIGVAATTEIIKNFSQKKQDREITDQEVRELLAKDLAAILQQSEKPLIIDTTQKPFVILMIGVNGAGKTTSIGKLAAKYKALGKQVSVIAADTFRAAAVEQLKIWTERAGIRLFSGPNGCDSAGLCYDGIQQAVQKGDDIVFIDTAGRLQNKAHLMEELKKIVRVIRKIIPQAPHQSILTIDATTGQNALGQIETFKTMIGVDGLIVTKLDGTARGGIVVAAAQNFGLPIYFIGVGEQIEDLDMFHAKDYARNLTDTAKIK